MIDEQKRYDEVMEVLVDAFINEVPLSKLNEVKRVFESNTWTKDHHWMIETTLIGRITMAEKRANKELVKVSSHVLTETGKFISLHMN